MSGGPTEDYPLLDLVCFCVLSALSVFAFQAFGQPDPRPWVVPAAIACCLLCTLPRRIPAFFQQKIK